MFMFSLPRTRNFNFFLLLFLHGNSVGVVFVFPRETTTASSAPLFCLSMLLLVNPLTSPQLRYHNDDDGDGDIEDDEDEIM